MISMIIPTLNAGSQITVLLDALQNQTVKPDEIIIVDSESDDNTVELCRRFDNVDFIRIKRSEFDHGRTRDMALRKSRGDIVLFMTQDAVPYDNCYIENLIKPFSDSKVAVVSGRQIAGADASFREKLVREFNYPEGDIIRSIEDLPKYGIKTYFCSDVCSAYRRSIYEAIGGFLYPLQTNEDMFFAASALHSGYKAAYASQAKVIHSHDFSLKEQYRRNAAIGYELEKHKELLGNVSANSEGMKLVKYVSVRLVKGFHFISLIRFYSDCAARVIGNKAGKNKLRKH